MTPQILRRYHQAQHAMVLLTMPTAGIMESTVPDITIPPELLTGPLWRETQRLRLEQFRKGAN